MADDARLIVVSNRVSVPTRKGVQAGGLAVGVQSALEDSGGLWFGWSGDIVEEAPAMRTHQVGNITYVLTDLTREEYEGFYEVTANRTLWPMFHYRTDLAIYERRAWAIYRSVNERFAIELQNLIRPTDLVWIHDYHLIPLGRELRKLGVQARLGFFLHIPFPAAQVIVGMPFHRDVVTDLCDYDLVGFQTSTDLQQFKDYISRELGGRVSEGAHVRTTARQFKAIACPIGIDVDEMRRLAAGQDAKRMMDRLQPQLYDRFLITGVDRLDYTKGIPDRLRGYECLLRDHPEHQGRVSYIQISAPSRQNLPEYVSLREEVEQLAGHINGRYGDADWMPLRYLNRSYNRRALAGIYRRSRVGLVTPLRDGLNLVAEEFVAAQDEADPGVLILSRFAGAAEILRGALIVNPFDAPDVGGALHKALTMPLAERTERLGSMILAIKHHDIVSWRERFLAELRSGIRPT